jgi:hypothetical protein
MLDRAINWGEQPASHGVNTHCESDEQNWYRGIKPSVNPIERRIFELGSFQLAHRKKYICSVRRKVVIPNRRYSWMLFEHPTDTDPVETIVLDVALDEAVKIDRRVSETLSRR